MDVEFRRGSTAATLRVPSRAPRASRQGAVSAIATDPDLREFSYGEWEGLTIGGDRGAESRRTG